ncbi:MAG: hypothetical protein GX791_03325, partial [Synergistaceae bacterium]|nr:hypothetical protein [Synergistaceae bacterium]
MPSVSQQFFLQKRELGLIRPIWCTMRLLQQGDVSEALAFHRKITEEIGDEGFFAEANTIEESISGQGAVAGVFAEGRLIALRAVSYVDEYVNGAMDDLELDQAEKGHLAVMDF